MGLRTAYKAYKRRERINRKSEAALPGLEMFSNDQIFFLSSANVRININNCNISLLFYLIYLLFFSFFLSYGVKIEIPKQK